MTHTLPTFLHKFCFFSLLLLFSITNLIAQDGTSAEAYMRKANEFKKQTQPDSAVVYYEKAALGYQMAGDLEKGMDAFNQAGILLTRQDRYAQAKTNLFQALESGLSLPDTLNLVLATSYISLGVVFAAEENYDESIMYHEKSLGIRQLLLGANHADVATCHGNIGNVYFRNKDFEKAEVHHLKAKEIREQVFGKESVETIQSYTNLGNVYKETKEFNTALTYYELALQNKIRQRGEGHKELVKFYQNISEVYFLMGDTINGKLYQSKQEQILRG